MKVDQTTLGVELPESGKPGRAGNTGGAETANAPSGTSGAFSGSAANTSRVDQASFSFDQTRLQSLGAQVLAQPEIRDSKVQALQEAIGGGSYSIPPSQVADALVNDLAS